MITKCNWEVTAGAEHAGAFDMHHDLAAYMPCTSELHTLPTQRKRKAYECACIHLLRPLNPIPNLDDLENAI